ncbi:hypothetical protein SK3146_02141 [Paenibacillus konkukensis]|uniref:Uncharacterized protein n=1 Tax=Paenibacillus konkukensis TaxID=2020716 RepID=A0ABY4RKE3_9BACL|nr:hypothetical protein [Paenibacillus konkukensis]UQZ82981.1 hypothetical protein SK3146_02141 [Paenibacillus konkukensis]
MKPCQRKRRLSELLLILMCCFFSIALPANAAIQAADRIADQTIDQTAAEGEEAAASPSVGTVSLADNRYFELKDWSVLADNGANNITFTVSVHNDSAADLMFHDYWVHLLTPSGSPITLNVWLQDKEIDRIAPHSAQNIRFYATVGDQTNLSELSVEFIQWDFSRPNFERRLGAIAVPAGYVTAAGSSREVRMGDIPVRTVIKQRSMRQDEKNYHTTIVYEMTNAGAKSAAVPAYSFAIRTLEGFMYPLDSKNGKDMTIDPQVTQEIELTGSIPVSVSSEGWQLVLSEYPQDLKLNVSVAVYELPAVSSASGGSFGQPYTFANDAGVYTAEIASIRRLPWEDQDLLTAEIVVANNSELSLPIPDMTGYYELDDAVKIEATLIQPDQLIGLAPGTSTRFQLVGKLPYTYAFSKVKLVLEEKESDTGTGELLSFTSGAELLNVPYYNEGETYTAEHAGRSAGYKVCDVRTYRGDSSDTFMIMLEASNLEKRYSDVTRLAANVQSADGTIFPAVVSAIGGKLSPGGKALLFLTASLPKGTPTSTMHVMIGEAIAGGKLASRDEQADGYIGAAAFWLPTERFTVQDDLLHIDLVPYELSMNRITTAIVLGELNLSFDYELKKDRLMETNIEGRKLVIAFEDENGNKTFTREYDFKDFEAAKPNDGTKDMKLRAGQKTRFEIKESDQDLIYKLETLKTYKLSVYDSFNGQLKLLAAKKIDWFATTD